MICSTGAKETKMECIGDKIAGINKDADCYRKGECPETGCEKCQIVCQGCDSCSNQTVREPEIADYVAVYEKSSKGWKPGMDEGVGMVAYIFSGDRDKGFKLKFQGRNSDDLEKFVWPITSLRLAMPEDVKKSQKIEDGRTAKKKLTEKSNEK